MALEPGSVVGDYRIEGMLGRGGMAVVYSARHNESGRQVALKLLSGALSSDPEFVARFRDEGRLQASLEHPHVVTVYDAAESEQGLYLAMRSVPGSTLATLIHERSLDTPRALTLLRQVADALDAAHAAGLVHRDVKPQNVLVGDADDAYLGDFGLTRVGGKQGITATGKLVGTVSYLAPEVIRGREATAASDRYAFAAMVFECLTGTVVYPRGTEAAILFAHTSEPVPRISQRRDELPRALDDQFAGSLAKEPGQRPSSARSIVDKVENALAAAGAEGLGPPPPPGATALEGTTVEPLPHALPAQPAGRAARRMAPWLAAAVLAGAALAAVVAILVGGDESEKASVPAPLAGTTVLGSDLTHSGRTVDCHTQAVRPSSPGCTIVQTALPGKTVVVPEDGAIRRWAVRSASGEMALVVERTGGGKGERQIARSANEFVSNDAVNEFDANMPVERGDHVGLTLIAGAAVGARSGVDGSTTNRWIPRLRKGPPNLKAGTGFDREVLLRVEYAPGGKQRLPHEVSGAQAAKLPPGRLRARRKLDFTNGEPVEIDLVQISHHFAVDLLERGRRTARADVPDFLPSSGGRLLGLDVYAEPAEAQQIGIYLEYVNEESQRIRDHFYDAFPHELVFVD